MHVGRAIGLGAAELWDLYYTLLLKDLGCSSNAARICELYLSDDLQFKRDFKTVGDGLPEVLQFVFQHTGLRVGTAQRLRRAFDIVRHGRRYAQELIQTRCTRGAAIARQLRFNEAVAGAIASLDEHWDGRGRPEGLAGTRIPLASRIALLAQVVDVFHSASGATAAQAELRRRSGRWFDPALVRAFESVAADPGFWRVLAAPAVDAAVRALEPPGRSVALDDDYLDDIATAFGQVVDSKSPYTRGHSERVARYADAIASRLDVAAPRRRWLRRAALLHDLGKLGVSNAVLDKPAALDAAEWAEVRLHPGHTEAILGRIEAFGELASVAGAHHERLDGGGYPRGLAGDAIRLETRIITVADIFDAISAQRPYRAAVPLPRTLEMMATTVGSAIDPLCFEALREAARGGEVDIAG
ncbi:MAG: HD domain-containing protein [Burkholderiales bacterium]|nr:HD domain-containing protein [Burkholderiales bacterium]MDE2159327.1 HD domain-containing protein [Burkholderiales bacterium]MDE2502727.1 HD domain-containing protein [Burkholderiales bacterium]